VLPHAMTADRWQMLLHASHGSTLTVLATNWTCAGCIGKSCVALQHGSACSTRTCCAATLSISSSSADTSLRLALGLEASLPSSPPSLAPRAASSASLHFRPAAARTQAGIGMGPSLACLFCYCESVCIYAKLRSMWCMLHTKQAAAGPCLCKQDAQLASAKLNSLGQ
jgi:hypothetical protein